MKDRSTLSPHTRTRLLRRNGKRVRAHRWIMEQHLGRTLRPDEDVHHVNGDPLDNRIENLRVMRRGDHMRLHKQKYPDYKNCVVCGTRFRVNPRKRKRSKCCSKECAQHTRVEASRLVPRLRGSSSPSAKLTDEQVAAIRQSSARQVDLARQYGVSQATISRVIRGVAYE